jgi:hypothetical protein
MYYCRLYGFLAGPLDTKLKYSGQHRLRARSSRLRPSRVQARRRRLFAENDMPTLAGFACPHVNGTAVGVKVINAQRGELAILSRGHQGPSGRAVESRGLNYR